MTWLAVAILIFFGAAAYDWCNVHFLAANSDGRALHGANWATATSAIGITAILLMSRWSMSFTGPDLAGVWVGMYLAIRFRTRTGTR
jgi:hypothetical protein